MEELPFRRGASRATIATVAPTQEASATHDPDERGRPATAVAKMLSPTWPEHCSIQDRATRLSATSGL